MSGVAATLILAALVGIILFKSVKVIPQGYKSIVQRWGKYHQTLEPGLNFIVPFMDDVAYKLPTKDIVLEIPSQEVITRDNAVMIVNAVAFINLVSPEKAVYGVDNYMWAIQNLVQTSLRAIIGDMDLDQALSSRDQIKAKLKAAISEDIADWGVALKTVEIQDIKPSTTMQSAMEEQAAAERQRRATVTRADGEKQAAILEAEGRFEASKRDADAQVVLAKASQQAINMVSESIGNQQTPVAYLLGEQYIKALQQMANSSNAKTVLLPPDIMSAVQKMVSGAGSK